MTEKDSLVARLTVTAKWIGDDKILPVGAEIEILAIDFSDPDHRKACWIRWWPSARDYPSYRSCDLSDLDMSGEPPQPVADAGDDDALYNLIYPHVGDDGLTRLLRMELKEFFARAENEARMREDQEIEYIEEIAALKVRLSELEQEAVKVVERLADTADAMGDAANLSMGDEAIAAARAFLDKLRRPS